MHIMLHRSKNDSNTQVVAMVQAICEENSGGCEALPDAVCLLSVWPKMGICRICICRVCRICLVFGQEKRRRRKEAYWEEKL